MTEPVEPKYIEQMTRVAKVIDEGLNINVDKPTTGFVLLMFDFNDESRVNYISNAERSSMLVAMKEFIARAEGRLFETETKQ